jgi:predicted RNA methylase
MMSEIYEGGAFAGYPTTHQFGKYWQLRYDIFSKFDQILFDDEGLYSTKPEKSCLEIARLFTARTILDPFCGIGGTTIAFASNRLIAYSSDVSEAKVKMALHNAKAYGCSNNAYFYVADAGDVLRAYAHSSKIGGIYIDPPWGGSRYMDLPFFSFSNFLFSGIDLQQFIREASHLEVALSLPLNFHLIDLAAVSRRHSIHKHDSPGRNSFFTAFFPKKDG